jgi:hypothetical protein
MHVLNLKDLDATDAPIVLLSGRLRSIAEIA